MEQARKAKPVEQKWSNRTLILLSSSVGALVSQLKELGT